MLTGPTCDTGVAVAVTMLLLLLVLLLLLLAVGRGKALLDESVGAPATGIDADGADDDDDAEVWPAKRPEEIVVVDVVDCRTA